MQIRNGSPDYVRERARILRKNCTLSERLLWSRLRRRGLGGLKLRRQQAFGRYVVDFCSYDGRVIVEIDGEVHAAQTEYDRVRDDWLVAQDVPILHFPRADIEDREKREEVLSTILATCLAHGTKPRTLRARL